VGSHPTPSALRQSSVQLFTSPDTANEVGEVAESS
jgi:hypothetical protein